MKQSEASEFWPLIKAWGEGKTIQHNFLNKWEDFIPNSEWHITYSPPSCYRIKPEPREWFLSIDHEGHVMGARTESNDYFTVRVREVTDHD
jgi:hypothetical protein